MLEKTRTMKVMLAAVAAVGLSLSAGEASAVQTTTVVPGSACQANLASLNKVEHNLWGVNSINQTIFTTATVSCPITLPAGALLQSVSVRTFDRNNGGNVVGANFSCTIFYRNGSGVTFTGPTNSQNAFSINNIGGFTMNTSVNVWGATIECDIPNQTPDGLSHLLNYSIVWQ